MFMSNAMKRQQRSVSACPIRAWTVHDSAQDVQIEHNEMGLYSYVGADPINFTDPLGLQEVPEPDPIIVTAWRPKMDQPGAGDVFPFFLIIPAMPDVFSAVFDFDGTESGESKEQLQCPVAIPPGRIGRGIA